MKTYYNETDPFPAEWLRTLYPVSHIDTRSITEVQGSDLKTFQQCHFFAGIGGWSEALRLAGWPDDAPVWTGSCPCQPYSQAGKGLGDADPRNLWPEFFRLIRECHPDTVFGEQVPSAIGHGWLDGISADLEGEGYAVGAVILGALSVKAPHPRQRLFWVADSNGSRECSVAGIHGRDGTGATGVDGLGIADGTGPQPGDETSEADRHRSPAIATGPWSDFQLVQCRDGKTRRVPSVRSEIQPLASGIPRAMASMLARLSGLDVDTTTAKAIIRNARRHRVGCLRGAGNSIVPQVAAEFIRAFIETKGK